MVWLSVGRAWSGSLRLRSVSAFSGGLGLLTGERDRGCEWGSVGDNWDGPAWVSLGCMALALVSSRVWGLLVCFLPLAGWAGQESILGEGENERLYKLSYLGQLVFWDFEQIAAAT
jgi:hypothetical protein